MDLSTLDAMLQQAVFPRAEEKVCLRPDLQLEWEKLTAELDAEHERADRKLGDKDDPELVARIAELEEQMTGATLTLTLQAMPRKDFGKLVDKHPPRKDDQTDKILGINQKTFFDALIGASIVDPQLDADRLAKLLDCLTDAQFDRIADAAWGLNRRESKIPFLSSTSSTTRKPDET